MNSYLIKKYTRKNQYHNH